MPHTLGLTKPNSTDHPKVSLVFPFVSNDPPFKIRRFDRLRSVFFVEQISFAAKEIDVTEWKGDLLVVGVTEKDLTKDDGSKFENPILNKLDAHTIGLLGLVSSEEDFAGKPGQSTVLRLPGLATKRIGLIGLGKTASSSSPAAFHSLGEGVATVSKASQSSTVAVALASPESESKLSSASALASGKQTQKFESL